MSSTRRWCSGPLALFAIVSACELHAELGSYATPGEDATGSTGSGESGGMLDGDGDGDGDPTTGDGTTGDGDPTTGDGDGDPTTGDGDGDGDGEAGLCAIDAGDSVCDVCLKHLCCTQLEACDDETGCFCMLDCIVDSDPVTCAMSCTPGLAYIQLVQCQAVSCGEACG